MILLTDYWQQSIAAYEWLGLEIPISKTVSLYGPNLVHSIPITWSFKSVDRSSVCFPDVTRNENYFPNTVSASVQNFRRALKLNISSVVEMCWCVTNDCYGPQA